MPPLYLFAFVSGLITILAPCIWPLLPIVLSASATGGHKKPLGVTVGILFTFGLFVLSISYILKIIPFDTNILRLISVIVIGFFGFTLLIPPLSAKLEAYATRLTGKLNLTGTRSGFLGGFIVGAALGIVWTPCAGPILATIATLSATQKVSSDLVITTIVYLIGVGIPLFLFAFFGRRFFLGSRKLSPYLGRIQQLFGLIMIITAVLIFTNYDKTLESRLLNSFPSFSDFQTKLESNNQVTNGLNQIKNGDNSDVSLLNTNAPAPDFTGITNWLNTKPLSLSDLKGKVVLVDFWTYTCINCIRTLPYTTKWYEKYKNDGFMVVGVHTPEFDFEKETSNVQKAIKQYGIDYPVAQDNNYDTWNAYQNQYWPAEYLIDAKGNVRRVHFGEGEYDQTEKAIQELLKENGEKVNNSVVNLSDQTPHGQLSPETYLGSKRMQYFYPNGTSGNGSFNFTLAENTPLNTFSLGGGWSISDESAKAVKDSTLSYEFFADKVFLVLGPGQNNSSIKVFLDGELIGPDNAGADVKNGVVTINSQRLYNLVDLKGGPSEHTLKIEFSNGVEAFAFTFG